MTEIDTDSDAALAIIRMRAPEARPRIAVLLGSGWGGLTPRLSEGICIPYAELDGFPSAGVAGHACELWLGRLGGVEVALLSGRRHAYEDGAADGMKLPLRTLRALGCEILIQTNAAGSLVPDMSRGSLMLVSDHLNIAQRSPLVGEGGSARFVDMVDAYDPALRRTAKQVAQGRGERLHEGVFAWVLGPQFETPAEIRMLRTLGAQAVGMSTVPETIVARHAGLRVLALSLITNMASGLSEQMLSHAHTLAQAAATADRAGALLAEIVVAIEAGTRA